MKLNKINIKGHKRKTYTEADKIKMILNIKMMKIIMHIQ